MFIEIIFFIFKNLVIYFWVFDKFKGGLSIRKIEELIFMMLKVMMMIIK